MENKNELLDNEIVLDNNNMNGAIPIINAGQFLILSIATMGLYEVWWMYKSWRFFKEKRGLFDILPAARALFSIFFLISLFEKILALAKQKGYTNDYPSIAFFAAYLIGAFAAYIPNGMGLFSVLKVAFLLPAFNALNFAYQHSEELDTIEQSHFNTRQIVLIIVGLVLWGFTFYGMIAEVE